MAQSDNKTKDNVLINYLKNNFFSIFAFIVSVLSAYFSIASYRDTVTQQAIDNTYKTFYDISALGVDHSDLMHVSTMPESYDMVQRDVHLSLMPINEQKHAEYILKERAFANYLFGFYENTLYQYHESIKIRKTGRTDFLKEILDYFRGRVLRNPRLLYLWDKHGGKLSINYAKSTQEDYDKNVLNNKDNPVTIKPDSVGPYFIDTTKVSR